MRAVPGITTALSAIVIVTAATACTDERGEVGVAGRPASVEDRELAALMEQCKEPLFTDQQQIPTQQEGRYGGGLMCAVPATNLARLNYSSYTEGPIAVAYVDVQGASAGYEQDNIRSGRNCIYIGPKNNGGSAPQELTDLTAWIELHAIETGAGCPGMDRAKAKRVKLKSGGEGTPGQIPPVVRIDMNYGGGRRTVIGLRCLETVWCEIANHNGSPPRNEKEPLHRTIAGWYDEQYLGVMKDNRLKPTILYASIYPHDELRSVLERNKYGEWQKSATIRFRNLNDSPSSDDVLRYYLDNKWGLKKYKGKINVNMILTMELKYAVPTRTDTFIARYVVNGFNGDSVAVVYHEDSDGLKRLLAQSSSDQHILTKIGVPAARWGWDPKDETSWVRCASGCCSVTGEDLRSKPEPGPIAAGAKRSP